MKKVLAGGVFSIVHEGHRFFLKRARKYGDFLIVVVASDRTALTTKEYPVLGQKERKANLEALGIADKVVVGDDVDFMETVRKEKPDVIVLGYDQKISEKELGRFLDKEGMNCEIVRIKEHLKGHKTSRLIKNKKKS